MGKDSALPILLVGDCYYCHCCGEIAASAPPGCELLIDDGQPLECGCNGAFSSDASGDEPYIVIDDCNCGAQ